MWMVRTGQPFLASVSAVARPCAATRSPMVLPAKSGSPASCARSASMRGPRPAAPMVMTVNSLSRGPAMKSWSWLCWSTGPSARDRRRALAVLAEALGPELHVPAREAFEPVGIGHHHGDRLVAERDRQRRADRSRHLGRRALRRAPAQAPRRRRRGSPSMSRPSTAAGSKPDIGEHRDSARRRRDRGRAWRSCMRRTETRRPLRLPPLAGSVRPRNRSGMRTRKPGRLHRGERGGGLHQGLAGAAGFRDRDKARGRERQPLQQRAVGLGIEIVHEMQARAVAQRADARHRVAGKLRQRLAAEARSAGAEEHDVGRAVAQSRRAAVTDAGRSSRCSGSRSSGKPPSAWRARSQSSAAAVRASASSSAAVRRRRRRCGRRARRWIGEGHAESPCVRGNCIDVPGAAKAAFSRCDESGSRMR